MNGSEVSVYSDGSGKASDIMDFNMRTLDKQQARITALRAFATSQANALAGIAWQPDLFNPEIEMGCRYYRGQPTTAAMIAELWPDREWERVEPRHGINKDTVRDWLSNELDGIRIRIASAEVDRPVKLVPPWNGSKRVRLPNAHGDGSAASADTVRPDVGREIAR